MIKVSTGKGNIPRVRLSCRGSHCCRARPGGCGFPSIDGLFKTLQNGFPHKSAAQTFNSRFSMASSPWWLTQHRKCLPAKWNPETLNILSSCKNPRLVEKKFLIADFPGSCSHSLFCFYSFVLIVRLSGGCRHRSRRLDWRLRLWQ